MGLETTTTIAGLVDTNPLDVDMISSGDDHLRLIKAVLKATFPGVGGSGYALPITVFEAQLNKLVPIVDNIAALKAQPKLGQKIVATLGYWAIKDGGHGIYWLDSADTTSVDNGGTIIVATDGGRWKLVYEDSLNIAQFGACTGVDDLVYINNAITWAKTVSGGSTVEGSHVDQITLNSYHLLHVSNTVTYTSAPNLHLNWPGGIIATDVWAGADTDPIVHPVGNGCTHVFGTVDCRHKCCGIEYGNYNLNIHDTTVIHGKHWQVHQVDGGGGSCKISINCSQWNKSDAEFADQANHTAKGFWLEGADSHFKDCNIAWCLHPIYIDTTAISNLFINCHIFQGTGGAAVPVPVDPIIVYNNCSNINFMFNCYFDNGYIIYMRHGLVIQGGMFIENALTSITEPWIRVYNSVDGASPYPLRISNIRASVGFFSGAPGVGTFPGDYTAINAIASDAIKGNASFVTRQDVIICPNDGDFEVRKHLKPVDKWIDSWKIGAGALLKWIYSTTGVELNSSGGLTIQDGTTGLGKVLFGSGDVGIGEVSNNKLSFITPTGTVWDVENAGHINPTSDQALDIGSTASSRRIKNLHARNAILSPSMAENSATNGTLWFEWVDDTHFKIEQRGSDGVLRSITFTTA